MKEAHLTLRLHEKLARALSRLARTRGVAKSQLVREAVAQYLGTTERPQDTRLVRARDLAERLRTLPRLSPDETADFALDIDRARKAVPPPRAPWE